MLKINGVEVVKGDTWLTKDGDEIEIVGIDSDYWPEGYHILGNKGIVYMANGKVFQHAPSNSDLKERK